MYCERIDFGTPEFDEAISLRYSILRKPLNMEYDPDDIAAEYDSLHLGSYSADGVLLGVLVLKPVNTEVVKMRQVAVCDNIQGKGVGSYLVSESEKVAAANGFRRIELHARSAAVPFYRKLGYQKQGNKFQEVGIDHYFMYKDL